MIDARRVVSVAPVIPVLTIDNASDILPIAAALTAGGIGIVEITLRTPAALDAIRLLKDSDQDLLIGAGTVASAADVQASVQAGASFLVSPGVTPSLLDAASDTEAPLLPGAGTVSEAMELADRGYEVLKFFPAEQSGGVAWLKSVSGPLHKLQFCPTGGVSPANVADYLALPNVACVGGSWLVPAKAVASGDFAQIQTLSSSAAALPR